MKVKNMTGRSGKPVANQFVIETEETYCVGGGIESEPCPTEYFQSYDTIIAKIIYAGFSGTELKTTLDREKWNYSRTTSKYRNQFLGETTKETQAKIDSGEYILADLN